VCSLNLCRFDPSALLFVLPYLKVADSRPKVAGLADHQILEGAVSMFQCSSFLELIVSQWRSCRLPDTLGRSFKRAFCCAICFAYRLKHIHDHQQSCCGQNWIDGVQGVDLELLALRKLSSWTLFFSDESPKWSRNFNHFSILEGFYHANVLDQKSQLAETFLKAPSCHGASLPCLTAGLDPMKTPPVGQGQKGCQGMGGWKWCKDLSMMVECQSCLWLLRFLWPHSWNTDSAQ